jgi:fructokinase
VIVVVGEALVDVVGDDRHPGGSPLNVAVGLGRLGVEVTLISEYADDADGALLRDHLRASGVRGAISVTARTGTAVADLSGPDPAYALDVPWTLPPTALPACDALHIGSIAALAPPGADAVAGLVAQVAADGCFLSYDLNLRTPPQAPASTRLHDLAAAAHLVKLSVQDAGLLAPGIEPDEVAQAFLGERTRMVVLTRGARGATLFTARAEVSLPASVVDAVDAIGAGDAATAGLLAALAENGFTVPWRREDLAALLSAAMQVAALSCTRAGAEPPWREELPPTWPGLIAQAGE